MSSTETKPVWVVWSTKDLNEGRSNLFPLHVCESYGTAVRLAKGAYVQGSDCPIRPGTAYWIDGDWYIPGVIIQPSLDDIRADKEAKKLKDVLDRCRAAGITTEDIDLLKKHSK